MFVEELSSCYNLLSSCVWGNNDLFQKNSDVGVHAVFSILEVFSVAVVSLFAISMFFGNCKHWSPAQLTARRVLHFITLSPWSYVQWFWSMVHYVDYIATTCNQSDEKQHFLVGMTRQFTHVVLIFFAFIFDSFLANKYKSIKL